MLENAIIWFCVAYLVFGGLYLRFAPTKIKDRSKRYIRPKRKGVKR